MIRIKYVEFYDGEIEDIDADSVYLEDGYYCFYKGKEFVDSVIKENVSTIENMREGKQNG